ncbi:MAG TPA: hypothetical protein VG370_04725 [Chloroflexota bacterium]|nr:hypothetical protein [Chloroflexota bacterium]
MSSQPSGAGTRLRWALAATIGAAAGAAVVWELAGGTLLPSAALVSSVGGFIVDAPFQPLGMTLAGALKFGFAFGATTAAAFLHLRRVPVASSGR